MKKPIVEILLIIVLGLLAFSTINPYWMPMGVFFTSLLALMVLFGIFAVYLWRETGGDEREMTLRQKSDRIAFLAGASILLVAIIVEGITMNAENPWILGAFSAMVIAKAGAYIYHEHNN